MGLSLATIIMLTILAGIYLFMHFGWLTALLYTILSLIIATIFEASYETFETSEIERRDVVTTNWQLNLSPDRIQEPHDTRSKRDRSIVGAGEDVDAGMGPLWSPVPLHHRSTLLFI